MPGRVADPRSARPGVRTCDARGSCRRDPRAIRRGETVLRVFHDVIDVPVEPQVTLLDDAGPVVGRADLLVSGTRFVHEYDGHHHRSAPPARHRPPARPRPRRGDYAASRFHPRRPDQPPGDGHARDRSRSWPPAQPSSDSIAGGDLSTNSVYSEVGRQPSDEPVEADDGDHRLVTNCMNCGVALLAVGDQTAVQPEPTPNAKTRQPLVEPRVSPDTNCFWSTKNTSSTGSATRTDPADSRL